jgi:cell division septum initiation protein DivIVA
VTRSSAGAGLGDVAADQVKSVLAAAEAAASEITSSARSEASEIVASARAEASALLERARADAGTRATAAQDAVEAIVEEAERLRAQVAELAGRVAGATPAAEVPGPVVVPEPTPPTIPEPTPDPVPEPIPDPVPEPTPEPSPDPLPDPTPEPTPDPLPDDPAAAEEPQPEPVAAANGVSTDDLIAQLKAGTAGGDAANGSPSAPAVAASDLGAARLVAMNMALEGADRETIAAQIRADFGEVPGLEGLLDEVMARAGR